MKKKMFAAVPVLFLAAALFAIGLSAGQRPFADLQAEDIASARVLLLPPGETVVLRDTHRLAELLQEIVLYRQDDSCRDYAGQTCLFVIEKTDGTRLEITAFSPFVIIDGVGYRCRPAPCEALSQYANRLLQEA